MSLLCYLRGFSRNGVFLFEWDSHRTWIEPAPAVVSAGDRCWLSRWGRWVVYCRRSGAGRWQVVVGTRLDKPLDVGKDGHEDATPEAPACYRRTDTRGADHDLLFGPPNSRRRTRVARRL